MNNSPKFGYNNVRRPKKQFSVDQPSPIPRRVRFISESSSKESIFDDDQASSVEQLNPVIYNPKAGFDGKEQVSHGTDFLNLDMKESTI